ncbi:hypothetical protein [Psychroflexus aestuariivivens]|uniref:hypothetical protein n=1 Tax=Psychroflexus aestuariivivens TaxID=1795040 RepID=UPI000FDBBFBB|nr:hypothetical protein [Psychroflexus aestuariivivens]
MRTPVLFLFFALSFITYKSKAQEFSEAIEYLEFVDDYSKDISKRMWNYTTAIAHSKNDRNIERKRNQIIKAYDKGIEAIQSAKSFEGEEFKAKVIESFELNKNLLNQDYAKVVDLKAISEQSYDNMEAYFLTQQKANEKMEQLQKEYSEHLDAYANRHNINLIDSESELGTKMKASGEVFEHNNALYLIFFKANIIENQLMKSISEENMVAAQQNISSLKSAVKEGLEAIDTVALYKDDSSVVRATKEALEFFMVEAEDYLPEMLDFLVLNSNFQKLKSKLDDTPERKRTKAQIDAFNKKVTQVNDGVDNYNKLSNDLNSKKQQMINNLNLVKQEFLATHIPKS